MKYFPIPLFFFLSSLALQAQVLPPDFLCVQNDTLIWSSVSNPCGPFEAYEIYVSPSQQGPYTLLARVTDPLQTNYFHPNPSGQTWFYYLISVHDCPGQQPLSSDTLDNRPPAIPEIRSVSVEGNQVRISWEPAISPDVNAYIIYRNTAIGTIPIDTVYNATDYLDNGADPNDRSEIYYVVALDRCNTASLFGDPHSTLFMGYSESPCEQTITLNWNLYQNWRDGIAAHIVWLSLNGGQPVPVDTVSGGSTSYAYTGALDGEEYCFFVSALAANTAYQAASNVVCLRPDLVQAMDHISIINLDVLGDNTLEITWAWDTIAELASAAIQANEPGPGFSQVQAIPHSSPLVPVNSAQLSLPTGAKPYSFFISTTDDCDSVFTSDEASSLFLQGRSVSGQGYELSWTPLVLPDNNLLDYSLFETGPSGPSLIETLDASQTSYFDPVDVGDESQSRKCYFVQGRTRFTSPSGTTFEQNGRSNVFCLSQAAEIYVPNAFAPRGINQEFKPVVVFGQSAVYQMRIFNRWGQEVFVSDQIDLGWNGKYQGKDAPAGIYTYLIRIDQPDGSTLERSGSLMLVR